MSVSSICLLPWLLEESHDTDALPGNESLPHVSELMQANSEEKEQAETYFHCHHIQSIVKNNKEMYLESNHIGIP